MKAFIPYMPPGYINMSSAEIAETYASGHAAFIGEYFDRLLLTLSKGPVGLERAEFTFFPTAEGNPKGANTARAPARRWSPSTAARTMPKPPTSFWKRLSRPRARC